MFKNFKLSQCDNFLYATCAGLAAALAATLQVLIEGFGLEITVLFWHGINWWITIISLVVMIISGTLWVETSLTKVNELVKQKDLGKHPENLKIIARANKLNTAYWRIANWGFGLMIFAIVNTFLGFVSWYQHITSPAVGG